MMDAAVDGNEFAGSVGGEINHVEDSFLTINNTIVAQNFVGTDWYDDAPTHVMITDLA